MKTIKVVQARGKDIKYQLEALYHTFVQISNNDQVVFDLTDLDWICPLLLTAMSSYIYDTGSQLIQPSNQDLARHLKAIGFPEGVGVTKGSMSPKGHCTFVSHIQKPCELTNFLDLTYEILGKIPEAKNAVFYPIAELVDNIFDHSKKNSGFLFSQILDKKKDLEVCIVDSGRGIKASYKEELGLSFDDQTAIAEALIGHSTKKDSERGYGMITSKKVICECLGGEFMLLSGQDTHIASKKDQIMLPLPKFNWQGVIITYRIPYPTGYVNIIPYLE